VTEEQKQDELYAALDKLIHRYMDEFDLTYISAMGALEIMKIGLACEAYGMEEEEEDDEGDDGDDWKIIIDDD